MIFEIFPLPNVEGNGLPGLPVTCPSYSRFKQNSPLNVHFIIDVLLLHCISQLKRQSCSLLYRPGERKSQFALRILSQQRTTYALRSSPMASPFLLSMQRISRPTNGTSNKHWLSNRNW